MSQLQKIVGRTLLGAVGMSQEFVEQVALLADRARSNWKSSSEILEIVRNAIAEFEPLLADHLSDTVLSAWINGYNNVAGQLPPWVQREFQDSIRRLPPGPPPTLNLFSMFEREPQLRLLNIENAAKRLFERKILTRDQFDDAVDSSKQQAFTIAGGLGAETIERFRHWLYEDISEGTSLDSFRNRVEEHLETSPIAPGHLETVYRTNVQSSFRDGRETLRQHPIVTAAFPYQEYIPIHDGRVRHEHMALGRLGLNGTGIYRIDDPVWDHFTPPWDYNCRCTARLLTLDQAAKAGVKEAQQWLKTGRPPMQPEYRFAEIPFEANPGWGSRGNVGVIVMSSSSRKGERWITIGADTIADNGEKTGGWPVKIDENGKMLTGKFSGKTLGEAFGKSESSVSSPSDNQKKKTEGNKNDSLTSSQFSDTIPASPATSAGVVSSKSEPSGSQPSIKETKKMQKSTMSPTGSKIEVNDNGQVVVTPKSGQAKKVWLSDLKKRDALPEDVAKALKKMGQNPDEYTYYGNNFLVHRSNQEFVDGHIAAHKQLEAERKAAEDEKTMKLNKERGKRYLYWSPSGGYKLTHGYPLTDQEKVEWGVGKEHRIVGGIQHPKLRDRDVDSELARKIQKNLPHAGSFVGHSNELHEISEDQWNELVRATADKKMAKHKKTKATEEELKKVKVPADVVAAYRSVRGNPDKLRDDIDHPMYWAIRRYADAIEAQGLGFPEMPKRDAMPEDF